MKKSNVKKISIFLLMAALILTIAACTRKPVETPAPNPPQQPGENQDVVVDPEPEGETERVTLYFANQEYIVTGNESLDKLIAVEREVTVGEKSLEEVVLGELQKSPEDPKLSTSVGNIKILSVETAENTAYVNISSDKLYGGSLEEVFILKQIVFSLTEIPGIEQVQFLVDGSNRETLMGHIMIQEPLTREEIDY